MLEYSECLAVPVGGGGRSELKDGRTSKCYTYSMGYDRVVDNIASVLVLRALLVESRNLEICEQTDVGTSPAVALRDSSCRGKDEHQHYQSRYQRKTQPIYKEITHDHSLVYWEGYELTTIAGELPCYPYPWLPWEGTLRFVPEPRGKIHLQQGCYLDTKV